ncbi:MAG: hypothetical protein IJ346_01215 [Clostridia bacterium]|nr:hypothetical protein [Clostridia bacterium]
MNNNKKEPWRIIVFIIAVLFIIYMFVSKSNGADSQLTAEQAVPALVTNVAVTVVKVAAIAAVTFLGKYIFNKIKNSRKE